jgi:tight adherence protein C
VTLFLLTGLALIGLSCVLVLRSFSFARARQRETLRQIGAYGFGTAAHDIVPRRDLRAVVEDTASAAGGRLLARLGGERERRFRKQLDAAGLYRTSVASFVGYRVLASAGTGGLVVLLAMAGGGLGVRGILAAFWLSLLGWSLPLQVVKRRAKQRIEQVDREVPELVDLLVTTVEAGVAFGAGIQLAARSIRGPLGDELRLVLQEQSLGLTPQEALENLAVRVESSALKAFTQALVQGESLGVSIGKVMRDLAVDMRKRRRLAAEERAQKAPTKILFPLVGLILPAMFILTLGPVVIRVVQFFGTG